MTIHALFIFQGTLEQFGECSVLKLEALAKYRPKFGRSNREPSSSGAKISPGPFDSAPRRRHCEWKRVQVCKRAD